MWEKNNSWGRATSIFNPPVLLSEHPQNHRSLEKGFDVISGPIHAFLQSHLSPWASSKARRGAWRPCHVPGSRWAVGGGPCTAERGAGGLRRRGDAVRLLPARGDAPDAQKNPAIILAKVLFGFWRLGTWQQAHIALLADPENAVWLFGAQESKNEVWRL